MMIAGVSEFEKEELTRIRTMRNVAQGVEVHALLDLIRIGRCTEVDDNSVHS